MSDEPKLLPCPFCGGEASLETDEMSYWIRCLECEAPYQQPTKKHAVDEWNTRIEPFAPNEDDIAIAGAWIDAMKPAEPQQGQGVPETIYIHHAGQITVDGTRALVFTSSAPVNFRDSETAYTLKATSDARIAELEAMNAALQAQKMRLIETQPDLAAELATARKDALEEAATVCDKRASLAKSITEDMQQYNAINNTASAIRALKDTQGEG